MTGDIKLLLLEIRYLKTREAKKNHYQRCFNMIQEIERRACVDHAFSLNEIREAHRLLPEIMSNLKKIHRSEEKEQEEREDNENL